MARRSELRFHFRPHSEAFSAYLRQNLPPLPVAVVACHLVPSFPQEYIIQRIRLRLRLFSRDVAPEEEGDREKGEKSVGGMNIKAETKSERGGERPPFLPAFPYG